MNRLSEFIRAILMLAVLCNAAYCIRGSAAEFEVLKNSDANLERRINNLEAMNIEHRMTAIETELSSLGRIGQGSLAGTSVLIIEMFFRIAKKRKDELGVSDG